MTRDEIVKLARSSEFDIEFFNSIGSDEVVVSGTLITDKLAKFANLVAEKEREKEREACARICEAIPVPIEILGAHPDYLDGQAMGYVKCAKAIRARSSR